jgi:hypothetical protein
MVTGRVQRLLDELLDELWDEPRGVRLDEWGAGRRAVRRVVRRAVRRVVRRVGQLNVRRVELHAALRAALRDGLLAALRNELLDGRLDEWGAELLAERRAGWLAELLAERLAGRLPEAAQGSDESKYLRLRASRLASEWPRVWNRIKNVLPPDSRKVLEPNLSEHSTDFFKALVTAENSRKQNWLIIRFTIAAFAKVLACTCVAFRRRLLDEFDWVTGMLRRK